MTPDDIALAGMTPDDLASLQRVVESIEQPGRDDQNRIAQIGAEHF
jgi:hypothetical protein